MSVRKSMKNKAAASPPEAASKAGASGTPNPTHVMLSVADAATAAIAVEALVSAGFVIERSLHQPKKTELVCASNGWRTPRRKAKKTCRIALANEVFELLEPDLGKLSATRLHNKIGYTEIGLTGTSEDGKAVEYYLFLQ